MQSPFQNCNYLFLFTKEYAARYIVKKLTGEKLADKASTQRKNHENLWAKQARALEQVGDKETRSRDTIGRQENKLWTS